MKVLVAGWFSFEQMGATAGDLLARDVVCRWLDDGGYPYDVAIAPPFSPQLDWCEVEPGSYSHVVFVCGPFGNGPPVTAFLERYKGCHLIGVNLSMLDSVEDWNPFQMLLERDSSRGSRPDISFLSEEPSVPLVGVVLVHEQKEYGGRSMHSVANQAVERLLASRNVAAVPIDTRLDSNSTGLRSAAQVESLISRMDTIVTTRLHGLVLALKNGVPPLVIDPIAGGQKVCRQAETVNWPVIFTADRLSNSALADAFDHCLSPEARTQARECRAEAIRLLNDVELELLGELVRSDQTRVC
jgi:hypothetical protein